MKTIPHKNTLKWGMLVVIMMSPAVALADLQLALKKQCMNCHQMESKRVGPPFKAIAQRYAGIAAAMEPVLARKIRTGGKGAWGEVGMPAMSQVSEAEAKQLAQWILQGRP
jgi:cytochrome c